MSNFRVVVADRDHASAQWVLSLYAADGEPILPSRPPLMLADVSLRVGCLVGSR